MPIRDLEEIAEWMKGCVEKHHETLTVDTLPSPNFQWEGQKLVSFSTNNYLALATDPRLVAAARVGLERYGVANCESRLLGGDLEIYRELEAKLARLKKKDDAVLFATGYLTNLGALSALTRTPQLFRAYGFRPSTRRKYAYFSDVLNHISIREGIRMSEAERVTYRHLDLNHLESLLQKNDAHCKIIVTDGVFSQDGDVAPLPGLMALAEKYDALVYVDDAHGTGVLGRNGGGISEHFNCYHERLIHMGTLSKAYGAIGGFVAADSLICEILRLTSSGYGFTSTIPPDQAFAISAAMDIIATEPARRDRLWNNQRQFLTACGQEEIPLASTETPIMPVIVGDEAKCNALARTLRESGYYIDSVQFPAVAKGQARLRVIINANHTPDQIDGLVEILKKAVGRQRVQAEQPALVSL